MISLVASQYINTSNLAATSNKVGPTLNRSTRIRLYLSSDIENVWTLARLLAKQRPWQ